MREREREREREIGERERLVMVKQADSQGYTPLHWAALHNHKDTVKVLLEKGGL